MEPKKLERDFNLDTGSYNYHLYPKDSDIEVCIACKIQCNRKKVIEEFQNHSNCQVVDEVGLSTIEAIQNDQEHSEPNIFYVYPRYGSRGLYLSDQRRYSGIFKCIAVKMNGIIYELNFMRFFVDNADSVNCILKSLQFDRCLGSSVNKSNENSKCDICYPKTACDQTEADLQTLLKNKSFCYNPSVSFYDDAKIIVEAFIRFIEICDRGI